MESEPLSKRPPLEVKDFPLTEKMANRIINDFVTNHSSRIKYSAHALERMQQRDITMVQVTRLLKNRNLHFQEGPYQTAKGNWRANIQGKATGNVIRVTVEFVRLETDPSLFIITTEEIGLELYKSSLQLVLTGRYDYDRAKNL